VAFELIPMQREPICFYTSDNGSGYLKSDLRWGNLFLNEALNSFIGQLHFSLAFELYGCYIFR
jgi:hypothetical protein